MPPRSEGCEPADEFKFELIAYTGGQRHVPNFIQTNWLKHADIRPRILAPAVQYLAKGTFQIRLRY